MNVSSMVGDASGQQRLHGNDPFGLRDPRRWVAIDVTTTNQVEHGLAQA